MMTTKTLAKFRAEACKLSAKIKLLEQAEEVRMRFLTWTIWTTIIFSLSLSKKNRKAGWKAIMTFR